MLTCFHIYLSILYALFNLLYFWQIASLLSDTSSILNDCMDTFSQVQDLKILLGTQKDLSQLEDIGEL